MAVAKSFEKSKILRPPFEKNGRLYVTIEWKGLEKDVRWYSEKERMSMAHSTPRSSEFNAKFAFGFKEAGYITLYKGNPEVINNFFKTKAVHQAYYSTMFHWYTKSDMPPVENLPSGVTPIKVLWEDVASEGDTMKDNDTVHNQMMRLISAESTSKFQGIIGEKIKKNFLVKKAMPLQSHLGPSVLYVFNDEIGNEYVWYTAANRTLKEGQYYNLEGSVKDHKSFEGTQQTYLTRMKPF